MNRAWVPLFTRSFADPEKRPTIARSITYFILVVASVSTSLVVLSPSKRKLLADHPRSYGRKQARLIPEHGRDLILATRHARDKRLLVSFLALGPASEHYLAALQERRPDWRSHLRRINALAEVYGRDETARIVADALEHNAFGSDYVQNILSFRARLRPEPGPLHVTRRQDLLELCLPEPNLDVYTAKETTP